MASTKSECYIKHFGKFKAGEEAINPLLSLGENVADSGGIKLAKMAYEHYAEQLPKESPLPGFAQFSAQQLFYIAFAQAWCDKSTEFQLEQTLLSDPHLPGEPRVSGTISLQPGFAKGELNDQVHHECILSRDTLRPFMLHAQRADRPRWLSSGGWSYHVLHSNIDIFVHAVRGSL
jgi:hypothetical protein